ATLTSNQSLTSSDEIVPSGLTVDVSEGLTLDTSTMSVTIPADGYYDVNATVYVSNGGLDTATYVQASIRKNSSSSTALSAAMSLGQVAMALTKGSDPRTRYLEKGDILYFRFRTNGSATVSGSQTVFSVKRSQEYHPGRGVGLGLATA